MIEIALWTEMVDQTYTVQDCVLEFIFKKFNVAMDDETAASALTLNERLHWHEEVDRKFQNTTFEATFDFRRKHFPRDEIGKSRLLNLERAEKEKRSLKWT